MIPVKGSAPSPRTPIVTVGLIVLNVLVFLFEVSLEGPVLDQIVRTFGFVPREFWSVLVERPIRLDVWLVPMITSMFFHGGWAHLLGNMIFLWVFGDGVENRIGPWRFLAFYLSVGLLASLTHGIAVPATMTPTIGASGAISGVLGAYLFMYPRSSVVLVIPLFFWPFFFQIPTTLFLGIWFLEQFFFGAMSTVARVTDQPGGVAWWAHIGGFAAGVALAPLVRLNKPLPETIGRPRMFPDRGST